MSAVHSLASFDQGRNPLGDDFWTLIDGRAFIVFTSLNHGPWRYRPVILINFQNLKTINSY